MTRRQVCWLRVWKKEKEADQTLSGLAEGIDAAAQKAEVAQEAEVKTGKREETSPSDSKVTGGGNKAGAQGKRVAYPSQHTRVPMRAGDAEASRRFLQAKLVRRLGRRPEQYYCESQKVQCLESSER
jgi:hypothetical protein